MPAAAAPTARVVQGVLSGKSEGGVSAFLGVPFAAPPVGANRWRAPQAPAAWIGSRAADQFSPSCWQHVSDAGFGPFTSEYVVHGAVSEDCLYLNIWTPAHAGAHLPVMVWIHGGAFRSGSASVPIYDGAALARKGILVVTVNYRLGVFGFLAHPDLTRESGGGPPANFGLQDIIASLRWMHDNIAAFGGDPAQVTIAGQSAGAIAVHDLIVSPLASGLFQRAIAESGMPDTAPPIPLATAEAAGEAFAKSMDATSIEALRVMPAAELASRATGPMFVPIIDGVLIPEAPTRALASGQYNHTPILTGLNGDEGSAMSPGYGSSDPAAFIALAQRLYGPAADRVRALYPAEGEMARADASRALLRDRGLAALYAWRRDRASDEPVFAYLFAHIEPGSQSMRWRAFHSSEIPYIFGTLDTAKDRVFTAQDRAISRTLSDYWVNFVRTGNPNSALLPARPQFAAPRFEIMQFGDDSGPRPVLPPETRAVLDDFLQHGGKVGLF